jgi:hypothetical protein
VRQIFVQVAREGLDALGQLSRQFGEFGVLLEQRGHMGVLVGELGLASLAGDGDVFAMMGVTFGQRLVAVGQAGLASRIGGAA